MEQIKYSIDRKLDNKHEGCDDYLIKFTYTLNTPEIIREVIKVTSRSGWLVGGVSIESLNYPVVGKGTTYSRPLVSKPRHHRMWPQKTHWSITVYKHEEAKGLSMLKKELKAYRNALLTQGHLIPV